VWGDLDATAAVLNPHAAAGLLRALAPGPTGGQAFVGGEGPVFGPSVFNFLFGWKRARKLKRIVGTPLLMGRAFLFVKAHQPLDRGEPAGEYCHWRIGEAANRCFRMQEACPKPDSLGGNHRPMMGDGCAQPYMGAIGHLTRGLGTRLPWAGKHGKPGFFYWLGTIVWSTRFAGWPVKFQEIRGYGAGAKWAFFSKGAFTGTYERELSIERRGGWFWFSFGNQGLGLPWASSRIGLEHWLRPQPTEREAGFFSSAGLFGTRMVGTSFEW